MATVNGINQVNGHESGPTDQQMEEDIDVQANGTHEIPPAELHGDPEYIKRITIPLNDTTAWKPRRKLRVVTIGAGYSGMIFAQKLQHKYPKEMDEILEHVIYEARDDVGGTWSANTYPGIMCDVPSTIYVRDHRIRHKAIAVNKIRHFHLIRIPSGPISTHEAMRSLRISVIESRNGIWRKM